jgi:hypothetical protein
MFYWLGLLLDLFWMESKNRLVACRLKYHFILFIWYLILHIAASFLRVNSSRSFPVEENSKYCYSSFVMFFGSFRENYQVYCMSEQKIKANKNELCCSVRPYIIRQLAIWTMKNKGKKHERNLCFTVSSSSLLLTWSS